MIASAGACRPARAIPSGSATKVPPSLEALDVEHWIGTSGPDAAPDLADRAVMVVAFQMLCPGCVSHALPQAARVARHFDARDVAVVGLHSVFEHRAAMTATALEAFVHEYRLPFPVGVDRDAGRGPPVTFSNWALHGTPSVLLFDATGACRSSALGQVEDIALGAALAVLSGTASGVGDGGRAPARAP